MTIKSPRGTDDFLPGQTEQWQYIEQKMQQICQLYNYKEIRTPIFEHTELFQRGVGETTDIVQKEMYTFKDRGNRYITLRPEGTAGVTRAYIENKLHGNPNQPIKVYYYGPMFRYERQQEGRRRQFHQFGVEVLGSEDPSVDAEVISLGMEIYKQLGLSSLKLVINSLGDVESRKQHRKALINHFESHINQLCDDCQSRLTQNPLRILDCKQDMEHPAMKTAPQILDFLNDYSKNYFNEVKKLLDEMDIEYIVDPSLVRGLDYYNHTTFEIMSEAEGFGAQSTLLGGGRYDGLVEQLGGPATPGVGFALGLERLMLALEYEQVALPIKEGIDLFFVGIGEEVTPKIVQLMQKARLAGFSADKDYQNRGVRAQFKAADRLKAKYTIILGAEELEKGTLKIRSMQEREETEITTDQFIETITRKLGGKKNE